MKTILILGSGQSSTILIEYLLEVCESRGWNLCLGDINLELAKGKIKNYSCGSAFLFDVKNALQLKTEVSKANLVISMLPPKFHILVAKECLEQGINLLTASYSTPEMQELHEEASKKGIIILNECGLDPGIDHMSAMKVMDIIREEGGEIIGFESFTGGLLAPTEDQNPWQYKFTWNPRNVVIAGQGVVKFLQEGRFKYIPYHRLFRRTEVIHIPKYGYFEGYANRDSLRYLDVYNLKNIRTMYRGTLRRPGFSRAWNIFVQLGATDDSYEMEGVDKMTHRQFINSFLAYNPHDSIELKLAQYLNLDLDSEEMYKIRWIGMFEDELVGLDKGTPAQILEHILRKKWMLDPEERDMIVMWHKFNYTIKGNEKVKHATLVAVGDDPVRTAMAKTVGLPLGIAAKLIVDGKIKLKGINIPISKELYEPILKELVEKFGIDFIEEDIPLN